MDWNDYEFLNFYGGEHDIVSQSFEMTGKSLRWSRDAAIELQYYFHSNYSIDLGVEMIWGIIQGIRESPNSDRIYKNQAELEIKTIPILLTLSHRTDTYPRRYFSRIGIGYYQSSYIFKSRYVGVSQLAPNEQSFTGSAKLSAGTVGFRGIVGSEYFIAPHLSLTAEIEGRYAKISGYKGHMKWASGSGEPNKREATLINRDRYNEVGQIKEPSSLIIMPNDLDTSQALFRRRVKYREAVMDFSGFSLRIGMACHF
ncbi:hypothetical protein ACFLT7_04775 [candidate division KSB1 bacterium]